MLISKAKVSFSQFFSSDCAEILFQLKWLPAAAAAAAAAPLSALSRTFRRANDRVWHSPVISFCLSSPPPLYYYLLAVMLFSSASSRFYPKSASSHPAGDVDVVFAFEIDVFCGFRQKGGGGGGKERNRRGGGGRLSKSSFFPRNNLARFSKL